MAIRRKNLRRLEARRRLELERIAGALLEEMLQLAALRLVLGHPDRLAALVSEVMARFPPASLEAGIRAAIRRDTLDTADDSSG